MTKIKNLHTLASTPSRQWLLTLAEEALSAIDTRSILRQNVVLQQDFFSIGEKAFSLPKQGRFLLYALGKAAGLGAQTLEDIFGDRLHGGIAIDTYLPPLQRVKGFAGTHPWVSIENQRATKQLLQELHQAEERDLLLFLISGGGSPLLAQPQGISLHEENALVLALTQAGASIQEINRVRRHLSCARGGGLIRAAYPARCISLLFSDVPDNDMLSIASGPTVYDPTTIDDAQAVLEKYHLSCSGWQETPKDPSLFTHTENHLFVTNATALQGVLAAAQRHHCPATIITHTLSGTAEEAAQRILADLETAPANTLLLYGGETTVRAPSYGQGGRNLHLALCLLESLPKQATILCLATDGHDNGPWAGAIVDAETLRKAKEKEIDPSSYLHSTNSFPFFAEVEDWIDTGPTNSNVADLVFAFLA